ncbi:hypothetical protein O1L68_14645 [Streptomyces lydicus]|nr:hypothetical protein [Streptomyces lydicus]
MLGSVRYAPDGAQAEDAIEAGASMLAAAEAGWEAVSAAVIAAAVAGVRQCWAGGWQPADLERIVRRDAPDASLVAVVVDAVAADATRPPGARPVRDPAGPSSCGSSVPRSGGPPMPATSTHWPSAAGPPVSRPRTTYWRPCARSPGCPASPRCRLRRRPAGETAPPVPPPHVRSDGSAGCSPRPRRPTTPRRRRRCPPRRRS